MLKESPVGFFDSGVGGLSVYSKFREALPSENTIYFGDLKNLPYGNKSKEELIAFARNILDFFKSKNVKAVVIACNTSSALAYDSIKNDYDFEIYPIIQSCAKVISSLNLNKVGVFATQGTVNSGAYKREITKYNSQIDVVEIACPNWVDIVEGRYDNGFEDIKARLQEMQSFDPDKVILGCTHYPYLLESLTKLAKEDFFIDPAQIFVDYISQNLFKNESEDLGKEEFYVSANPEAFVKNAQLFYELKQLPTVV